MAVKQYIGARYVPLMDGTYNPNKEYEPLTTVSYGQATYTSRKKVPAGVLPTDSEYWMFIPSGSQAVAELEEWKTQTVDPFMQQTTSDVSGLQSDVSGLQSDVSGLQSGVSGLQSDVSGLQSDVSGLGGSVDNINSEITRLHAKDVDLQNQINNIQPVANTERKYVFIGDSYGAGLLSTGGVVTGYPELVKQYMGLTSGVNYFNNSKNGAGFINNPTFESLLIELEGNMTSSVDRNTITDVIVCGGWNDSESAGTQIWNAGNAFVSRCKTLFPKAIVHVGMIAYCTSPTAALRARTLRLKHVAYNYNYIKNASTILNINYRLASIYGAIETSGNNNHPSQLGQELIAEGIISHLYGGDVYYGMNAESNKPTYTAASGVNVRNNDMSLYEMKNGGMYTLVGRNAVFDLPNGGGDVDPRNGIPLFTMTENIGHGFGHPYTSGVVTGTINASGHPKYVPIIGRLALIGDTVYLFSETLNISQDGFLPASYYNTIYLNNFIISFPIDWA